MGLSSIRVKAVWFAVIPFLWFAAPTPELVTLGGAVAALGLLIRAWAAGTIRKRHELATSGPYAFTRNPLYLGSFLIGLGVTIASAQWIWPALFVVFFAGAYGQTMAREAREVEERFGERARDYSLGVPAFFPRVTPYRPSHPGEHGGFSLAQYRHNKEWEAALGVVTAFAFLAFKSGVFG